MGNVISSGDVVVSSNFRSNFAALELLSCNGKKGDGKIFIKRPSSAEIAF
jgi:hypothetical protein